MSYKLYFLYLAVILSAWSCQSESKTKDGVKVKGKVTQALTDQDASTIVTLAAGDRVLLNLPEPIPVNALLLSEAIAYGQHVRSFTIYLKNQGGEEVEKITGTTIGHKRILTFPPKEASAIEVVIEDANGAVFLNGLSAFYIDENLIEK